LESINIWGDLVTIYQDSELNIALSGKREEIIAYLEAVINRQQECDIPDRGFTITMPCGHERNFREADNIPVEDLPCPCGKGFLIKLD